MQEDDSAEASATSTRIESEATEPNAARLWPLIGRLVLLLAVTVSAASPILVYDTDLWYHLRHARQLIETGSIVDSTDFSYLEPSRPFTNYYWLFQVLVFGVFSLAGFGGLIALRTAVWALLLWGIDRLVRGDRAARLDPLRLAAGWVWLAVLPALAAGVLLNRALNLRPHLLSYTCLVLLLVAFERRRAPLWAVAVGIVWSNVHGVAYPVLWAIVGAYGLETLLGLRSGRTAPSEALPRLGVLTATGLSMLATPHFLSLLPVPFRSTQHASRIIGELQPFDPSSLLRIDLSALDGSNAFTLFAWLLAVVLAARLWRFSVDRSPWRPRPAHLLLLAAGLGLLAKAGRLQVELTLLALPLLREALTAGDLAPATQAPATAHAVPPRGQATGMASVLAALLLLALGVGFLDRTAQGLQLPHPLFDGRPEQAASGPSRLPIGTAAWLSEYGPGGGRLLNQADYGGYWMWTLEGRYLVHMDLELPFAFSSMDFFELRQALYDSAALDALLERHRPDFLAVDARPAGFEQRLRAVAPRFVPVFMDDAAILWADSERHPQLGAQWRLEALDVAQALADPSYAPPAAARSELLRLRQVAPGVRLPHRLLANQALASGQAELALGHAGDLVAVAPERARSWQIYGDALMANRRPDPARDAFETALDLTPNDQRRALHRRLAYVELALGRPGPAYGHISRAVDIDVARGSLRDLELLARLAEQVGETEHAAQVRQVLELRQRRRSSSMASP